MARMGITRIANVTGLDRIGVPVVMVIRPNSRSIAVSQGKGLELEAAKVSGLMESVETWHAERIALPLALGSYDDLEGDRPLVDIESLPRIEGSRYRPDLPMLWIQSENLVDGGVVWVPYEMVHSNYTLPRPTGHGCFHASTNGLASGNVYLEACCHAICEVIERDATCLWHHLSQAARAEARVDLTTVDDVHCLAILDRFRQAGVDPAVWETTTDVGVPSFYCLAVDDGDPEAHLGAGAGAHPRRGIALSRALTEAAQTRLTYITGSRDDLLPAEFGRTGMLDKRISAAELMSGGGPSRRFDLITDHLAESFEADIEWLLERLAAVAVDTVAVIDLTRTDIDIPVVRVIVPGLEAPHDDSDYVPGPRALAARGAKS